MRKQIPLCLAAFLLLVFMYAFQDEIVYQSLTTDSGWDTDYDYDYDYDSDFDYDTDYDYGYDSDIHYSGGGYTESSSQSSNRNSALSPRSVLQIMEIVLFFVLICLFILGGRKGFKDMIKIISSMTLAFAFCFCLIGAFFVPILIVFVPVLAALFFIINHFNNKNIAGQESKSHESSPSPTFKTLPVTEEDQKLLDLGYQMFVDVQNAWMNFDYDSLRKLLTDELYHTYENQLGVLELKKQKNIMKDFEKKEISLISKQENGTKVSLKMLLEVEFYDYVINDKEDVIRGNKNRKVHMTYYLTFVFDSHAQDVCPGCGSNLENGVTVCPYCGSSIQAVGKQMKLAKKEAIHQK